MRYTLGIICSIILVGSAFAQTPVKSIFKPEDVAASISALTHLISDTTSSENTDCFKFNSESDIIEVKKSGQLEETRHFSMLDLEEVK